MIRYGIFGAGWRAEFYLRLASLCPEQFEVAGIYIRNPETRKKYVYSPFPVFDTAKGLLAVLDKEHDFIVSCVKKTAMASVVTDLAKNGWAVLSETPAGVTHEEAAALAALGETGARVQVAEQFHFQPLLAAVKNVLDRGYIGNVHQLQLSLCHDYHAVSLMRFFLGTGLEKPEIRTYLLPDPVTEYDGRPGRREPILNDGKSKLSLLRFGDKTALYDFCQTQYFSDIRSSSFLIRGEKGEIRFEDCRYLKGNVPHHFRLERKAYGANGDLDGYYLSEITGNGEVFYENPFPGARLTDEEIAIGTCLLRMKDYIETGKEFYSLRDAAFDAEVAMEMGENIQ